VYFPDFKHTLQELQRLIWQYKSNQSQAYLICYSLSRLISFGATMADLIKMLKIWWNR
jgi:hypothetical protein